MATALVSGLIVLILYLHNILHQNDAKTPDSYRGRLERPMRVHTLFSSLRDNSGGEDSNKNTIILAYVHFKPDLLRAELDKTPVE
jgi:hypothetical protein